MFSHFSRTPTYDGQTDRPTSDDSIYCFSIALHGKKCSINSKCASCLPQSFTSCMSLRQQRVHSDSDEGARDLLIIATSAISVLHCLWLLCECRHKTVPAADADSSVMECVESVSLLSLPSDCSLAAFRDSTHADSKPSTHRFSPRYVNSVLLEIVPPMKTTLVIFVTEN